MERRDFLKTGTYLLVGAQTTCALRVLAAPTSGDVASPLTGKRWGMLIDVSKCTADCDLCTRACRQENNVAFHGDERWDVHWIRKVRARPTGASGGPEKSVPLLCNHCDEPPCAQVCPVQATFKRTDGIVMIDHHRCIGCRYCMIACPYNARYFNYKESHDWPNKDYPKRSHGVAESCNLCAHLLDRGQSPACMAACATGPGAILVGDLNDPDSEISQRIAGRAVKRLREELGTEPKVYYLGL